MNTENEGYIFDLPFKAENDLPRSPSAQPEPEPTARAHSPQPTARAHSPQPVCPFFLAQILTLRAHFHQILTLLNPFGSQNIDFAQILTLRGPFTLLTRTF